jgi:hypothetical protein
MIHLKDIKPTVDPYAPLLKHHKYLFRLTKFIIFKCIIYPNIVPFLINILQRLNEEIKKLSDIHSTLLIRNQLLIEIADDKSHGKEKEKRKLVE